LCPTAEITINDAVATKRLFESLLHEVRVTSRSSIKPYFRILQMYEP
jgi:hypothetical protein